MGNPLTPSQRQALTFIREFMAHHRFAPTAKEIADRFGIAEKNGFYYLDVLERKGYLRRGKHQPRRIELLGEPLPRSPVRVPVLGRIPAGSPSEAIEGIEGEARVKGLGRKRGKVRLEAANPAYPPLVVPVDSPSFRIAGKVIGVF